MALRRYLCITAVALSLSLFWFGIAVFRLAQDTKYVRRMDVQRDSIGEWRSRLQRVLIILNDAETAQRGYLLTGRERYLMPYRNALRDLPSLLGELGHLDTREGSIPAAALADIPVKAKLKLGELAETMRLADEHSYAAAMALVKTDAGEEMMEQLRIDIAMVSSALVEKDDALRNSIEQSVAHRERTALLAGSALAVALVLAAIQVLLLLAAQRRFEKALIASEQRYRALIDEQMEIIVLIGPDGLLRYHNPAFGRLFAPFAASFEDKPFLEWIEPADRAVMQRALDDALTMGESVAIESRVLAGGDQEHWISWRLRAQQGAQAPGVQAVGRNVTARKAAELALRASEEFLRRTGRVAGIGGWEVNLNSGELHLSTQVRRILELDDDLVISIDGTMALLAEDARDRLRAAMDKARFHGMPWDLELPVVPASGLQIYVRSVGEAELNEDGIAVRLLGTLQDITDRKRLELELEANERFIRGITDAVPVSLAYIDGEGRVQFANRALYERMKTTRENMIGRHVSEFSVSSDMAERMSEVRRGLAQRYEHQDLLDGDSRQIETQLIPDMDGRGALRGLYATSVDITHLKQIEATLREQSAILNALVEASPSMMAVCDRNSRYVLVNKSYERWRGIPRSGLIGRLLQETMSPEQFARSRPWQLRALAGETVAYEQTYPDAAELRHVLLTYRPLKLAEGEVVGFFCMAQDMTAQREERMRLQKLVERDPLTGLLNRSGFEQIVESRMRQGAAETLAVLYIDLDHFKPINDTYGHSAGDVVLKEFASRLQRLVRPDDAAARLGGDEFALVLSGIRRIVDAGGVAEKIVQMARKPFFLPHGKVSISASIGVACDASGGWKDLVERADAMTYRAKAAGRDRWALADAGDALGSGLAAEG